MIDENRGDAGVMSRISRICSVLTCLWKAVKVVNLHGVMVHSLLHSRLDTG